MIVVDASAALSALLNDGPARRGLGTEQIHVPHLIDSEVASGLRKGVAAHRLDADSGWTALDTWASIGDDPVPGLLTPGFASGSSERTCRPMTQSIVRGTGRTSRLQLVNSGCSTGSCTRLPLCDHCRSPMSAPLVGLSSLGRCLS